MNSQGQPEWQVGPGREMWSQKPPKPSHPQHVLGLYVPPLPVQDRHRDAICFPLGLKKHSFNAVSGQSQVTVFHPPADCMFLLLGNILVQVNP